MYLQASHFHPGPSALSGKDVGFEFRFESWGRRCLWRLEPITLLHTILRAGFFYLWLYKPYHSPIPKEMDHSNKENLPPWTPTFGPRPRRPPQFSPPFEVSPMARHLDSGLSPGLSMASQQPAPFFGSFPTDMASSMNLQQLQRGSYPAGPPLSWIHSPPVQYPSLQNIAAMFETSGEQHNVVPTHEGQGEAVPAPVTSQAVPLVPWPAQQIPGAMGIHHGLVMNPSRPLSPAGSGVPVWTPNFTGTTTSLPVPTRSQLRHDNLADEANYSVQNNSETPSVPSYPNVQPTQAFRPNQPVERSTVGNFPVSENTSCDKERTHLVPSNNPVQGATAHDTTPPSKFKSGRPGMRDVYFIRLLSAGNPFEGQGHKIESFGECARKLKTAPETAAMFAGISENNNSKTLVHRFDHLKHLLQADKWVPVEGGTEADDVDLRNRLQMLMKDEEEYMAQRRAASERRRDTRTAPVFASDAREAYAQNMARGDLPTPTEASHTVEGEPVSSDDSDEDRGASKRHKKTPPRDEPLVKVRTEMKQLNDAAIKAQLEQSAGTHKLFAADLALAEKSFDFNSGLRKREVELAERRFEHEVRQDKKTDEKIDDLKTHVGEQFDALKAMLGQIIAGGSSTGATGAS